MLFQLAVLSALCAAKRGRSTTDRKDATSQVRGGRSSGRSRGGGSSEGGKPDGGSSGGGQQTGGQMNRNQKGGSSGGGQQQGGGKPEQGGSQGGAPSQGGKPTQGGGGDQAGAPSQGGKPTQGDGNQDGAPSQGGKPNQGNGNDAGAPSQGGKPSQGGGQQGGGRDGGNQDGAPSQGGKPSQGDGKPSQDDDDQKPGFGQGGNNQRNEGVVGKFYGPCMELTDQASCDGASVPEPIPHYDADGSLDCCKRSHMAKCAWMNNGCVQVCDAPVNGVCGASCALSNGACVPDWGSADKSVRQTMSPQCQRQAGDVDSWPECLHEEWNLHKRRV